MTERDLSEFSPTILPLVRNLPPRQQAHLVGVCGAGMRALAEVLLSHGWKLSASDSLPPAPAIQQLIRQGLTFHHGHAAEYVPVSAQVVIHSPAVPLENPERTVARERGIPDHSLPEFIGTLMREKHGVCIAGTHGKSTTTAMVGTILADAGRRPSVILGAELVDGGRSGWAGSGDEFVVESCEFQRSFLHYAPQYAALLSVQLDHVDCFPDLAAAEAAFREFAQLVPADGAIVACRDCPATMRVVDGVAARTVTFGTHPEATWRADDLRKAPTGERFRMYRDGQFFLELALRIPGKHNVLNALAAAALTAEMGVSAREIRESLQEFQGIRRRFESLGTFRGVTIIDDYAHHPTAVQATLQTARELYGRRRIWCVFQPHQVSRTRALMDEFASSFGAADQVIIAPVFAAREADDDAPQLAAQELTQRIRNTHPAVDSADSLDRIVATLEDGLRPGDVLLTMGAGNIDRVHHELTRRIQRHSHPRRTASSIHLDETGRSRTVLPHTA